MKRLLALADDIALGSLILLTAANMLFFVAFLLVALLATVEVRAATPVACTGKNMVSALEREDPDLLAKIRADAAATPNGKGLLWRVQKQGVDPSFLFGTMHITDPRVTALTPAARRAFQGSRTVAIETTDILDQSRMMSALASRPELMMFTDGTTLLSLLSPDDAKLVSGALQERGIPPASVAKMKPWMLAAMVALPACEIARKAAGEAILDVRLAQEATASGKRLEGLETVTDQLEAMASLPLDFHMKGLVETLRLGDKTDDVIETMIELYLDGETGMYWPLFQAVLPAADGDGSGYAQFEETMVTARNRTMASHAAPLIEEGGAFIAVGALHLPGGNGLVELLRRQGYTVHAAD